MILVVSMHYHLCCGPQKILPGWINVDREKFGQEVVADINKPWSFSKPGSAEYILIEDGLEHVESLEHFLESASRILKVGGTLEIQVPHFKNPSAYRFTHRHFFSHSMFTIFLEPHDRVQDLRVTKIHLLVDKRFPLSLLDIFANAFPAIWERFFYVSGIRVWLTKTGNNA
ncbi:MAG: hypothetical protein FJY86_00245 [Candidatus Diapherotrites archaeon]|uniref:Class I SAM-dependent methyltransferase n=1 Tax=Candidatus Iainarchaeum sp. TaxID=3101447 RepID=A0A8T4C5S3_9ARCH|nr:hypothetical protein [Candidatus Diapherotrites archaeon]